FRKVCSKVKNYLNYVKSFDLLICSMHREKVKYEIYIKFDKLIIQYKDFVAYKASSEPNLDNKYKCAWKCSNFY
ncbi:CYIR protein, partial [Plasmodium cynomolgi strain B]